MPSICTICALAIDGPRMTDPDTGRDYHPGCAVAALPGDALAALAGLAALIAAPLVVLWAA
jgi:hypothetical protein